MTAVASGEGGGASTAEGAMVCGGGGGGAVDSGNGEWAAPRRTQGQASG